MKILDIKYKQQINLLLNLYNNDFFVIKYLVKKIYKPTNIIIKNKKNIIYENDKKIEFNMNGLLFTININNNILKIFTINKIYNKNNVLSIIIDINNKNGYIESFKKYKKYTKFDILNIGLYILNIYINKNIINNYTINNECFIDNKYYLYNDEINKLKTLLTFYTNIYIYINCKLDIKIYSINELFIYKLNRINNYKIKIYNNYIKHNYINKFYDIIINNKNNFIDEITNENNFNLFHNNDKNTLVNLIKYNYIEYINKHKLDKYEFIKIFYNEIDSIIYSESLNFNKNKPLLDEISKYINYLKNFDKNILNNYIIDGYNKLTNIDNLVCVTILFNIQNYNKWIKNINKKFIIWNSIYNINNNFFISIYKNLDWIDLYIIINKYNVHLKLKNNILSYNYDILSNIKFCYK
jgi:hypothetical protein